MCGLFGFLKTKSVVSADTKNSLYTGAYLSGLRGTHGAGIFSCDDTSVIYYKKPFPISDFIDLSVTKSIIERINSEKFIAFHSRKISSGDRTQDATHPFTTHNLTVMHNGSAEKLKGVSYPWSKYFSDSHWMSVVLDESRESYKEFLESYVGAYALTWMDNITKDFYIARNSDRPLSYVRLEDGIMYASEASMLDLLIERHSLKLEQKDGAIIDFTPYTLYKFSNEVLSEEFTYKEPPKSLLPYYNNYNYNYKETTKEDSPILGYKKGDIMWFKSTEIIPHRKGSTVRGTTPGGSSVAGSTGKSIEIGEDLKGVCCGFSKSKDTNKITYIVKNIEKDLNRATWNNVVRCHSCGTYTNDYTVYNNFTVCGSCAGFN